MSEYVPEEELIIEQIGQTRIVRIIIGRIWRYDRCAARRISDQTAIDRRSLIKARRDIRHRDRVDTRSSANLPVDDNTDIRIGRIDREIIRHQTAAIRKIGASAAILD